jgi:hypothetical protein
VFAKQLQERGRALEREPALPLALPKNDAAADTAERRSRYLIDLAAAHAMRRQIGEALNDLQEAEKIAPEQTRTHRIARDVTRDLLQLSGLRPRPELRDLAERFGVLP